MTGDDFYRQGKSAADRPTCRLCDRWAVVVDTPSQRTLVDADEPWCAAHTPRRPREGFERVPLDPTRTGGSER